MLGRWVLLVMSVACFFPSISSGVHGLGPEGDRQVRYVRDEIIVKFRVAMKSSESLDKLNRKYGVKNARPVFKGFGKARWRVDKIAQKDGRLVSKKESRILDRLKRVPRGVPVPDLGRIYRLEVKLGDGVSLEEVVAEYNKDRDVEYAELNYIVSVHSAKQKRP